MATLAFYGEAAFVRTYHTDPTHALFIIERAQVFPFQYRIREKRAVILATNEGIPPDIALEAIDDMLRDDPSSPQLLYLRIIQEARVGRKDYRSLLNLADVLPDSLWVRQGVEIIRGLVK